LLSPAEKYGKNRHSVFPWPQGASLSHGEFS
jgi:hypothetical protein